MNGLYAELITCWMENTTASSKFERHSRSKIIFSESNTWNTVYVFRVIAACLRCFYKLIGTLLANILTGVNANCFATHFSNAITSHVPLAYFYRLFWIVAWIKVWQISC